MGSPTQTPINEAVNFLDKHKPQVLEKLRQDNPDLGDELKTGILAGERSENWEYRKRLAAIMSSSLSELSSSANQVAIACKDRVRSVRRVKFASELLVLLGSSSLLGTLQFGDDRATFIAAGITFVAGCGTVFVEQVSMILNPELGDIFSLYPELYSISNEAKILGFELTAATESEADEELIVGLVSRANALFEKANKHLPQIV